ncbi:exonuclease subunit SbcD [Ferribacterium limneticum]|uniref:exonuclease subunit SbcD n=1 Tax=Ferribacterium limneticum TaxID=76259 RepID=UPI001CFA96BD|nr:exonuclease subunit SbcD [Ferribacterium limneticum]UCV30054.1 exonuclease subunit SbcD [Ferribacterium limneticum]UCV33973.1 exonuclease subunit SbcD [Ferribacterium limneticum]
MRLLHTSDWHLGQHFMGKSRQAEHQALIVWLLEQVETQAVDAVLIAGDIFDTGTPPSYARELYNQLVGQLYKAGVPLLVLGGNHDSPATLGESRELLAHLGTTVIAATHADPATQVIVLPQRKGDPGCIVCAIPFVRPRDVLQSLAGQSAEDKQLSLQTAIQEHYSAVFAAAVERQTTLAAELGSNFGRQLPIIATGHLTTVGASTSESVREIYVGALEAFPTAAFPPAAYIALGHIHRPQKVGGLEHIRYCGSPIPLGFDEAKQTKEMLLVDLDFDGLKAVTVLPVPRFQSLVAVSGNLDTLAGAIGAAAAEGTRERPAWLEVTVAEDDYLADLPARIEALTEGWPVEVLRIRRQRGNAVASLTAEAREMLDELSPHDVFARRLQQEALSDELQHALNQRYRAVVASLTEDAA